MNETGEQRDMGNDSAEGVTLYASDWCSHSRSVERFLEQNKIPTRKIQIDGDDSARAELIELNHGYASTPTLVLADGSILTEPSLDELRRTLGLTKTSGLAARIRGVLRDKGAE
jgi:mycoredoxin